MLIRLILLSITALALVSCSGGGGGGGGGSVAPSPPSVSIVAPTQAYQDRPYSIDLTQSNVGVQSATVTGGPSWLVYNSNLKKLEGVPDSQANYSNMKVSVVFADGSAKEYGPYSLSVSHDPLKNQQWNLKNTGQNAFSSSSGTAGMDINIDGALAEGAIGSSSVQLVVSDGRIDLSHEDISANANLSLSKNYTFASPYSGNPTSSSDNSHGTTVASLMGAVGWNNIGMRGVCPTCKIIGYNFLESDQTPAKQINQASTGSMSVYNYSYGFGTCQFTPADSGYLSQVKSTSLTGRSGKGIVFVTSAGNDFSGNNGGTCNFTYLGNSNLDQTKSYPYFITVGAVDAQGYASSYSTPGANTWIVAPGGDGFGQTKPSLIAADLEGCSLGSSKTSSTENAFESNSNGLNPSCKYTSTATGTSFASPTVAGVVGLLLSINSNLTWRDIKHILASTAKQVHSVAGNTTHPLGYNLSGHIYQQGWVTNSAGFKFHNWYGFGLVDAGAAVVMAKNYSSSLGSLVITEDPKTTAPLYSRNDLNLAVPDNSAVGVTDQIYLRHNLKVEAVQISFSIEHTAATDLGVELTSPSGTKSILMNINSGITNGDLTNFTLLSNAFYGESSIGNWTIKVVDGASADTGILNNWSIKVWGGKVVASDTTAPIAPSNLVGPNYFMSDSVSPKFTWTASPSGDLLRYEYCIGVSAGDCSLYPWTGSSNLTSGQAVGMYLTIGNTYYFNLRAVDTSENTSTIISDSWVNDDGGTWTLTSTVNAPSPKIWAKAVSTGSEAIIINGFNGSLLQQTHKYNPATNSWSSGSTPPTYSSSDERAPVWNGSELMIWTNHSPKLKIYNNTTNTWSAANSTGMPGNSSNATLVWTGTEAIVWGGGFYTNTGSRYNRLGNTWSAMTNTNAPIARHSHSAIWSGSEMIIWGGQTGTSTYTNTGARYNPTANTWSTMTTVGAPSARYGVASVWTGSRMIVWGGYQYSETDGAIYNPTTNTWTKMSSHGAPAGCGESAGITAAWSGSKMFVAGCNSGYGGMYDLSTDTWQLIKPPTGVRPSYGQTLLWLNDKLFLWGGTDVGYQNTGATYVP